MEKKPREIPFENGFLNELRSKAKPLDEKTREEIRKQAEANKAAEPKPTHTRLSDCDLSNLSVELK